VGFATFDNLGTRFAFDKFGRAAFLTFAIFGPRFARITINVGIVVLGAFFIGILLTGITAIG
jgi:hypothetical protein